MFLASLMPAAASFSKVLHFSIAALMLSTEASSRSPAKNFAASCSTATCFSTLVKTSRGSVRSASIFRSLVSFLKFASFSSRKSSRSWSGASSSVILWLTSFTKRLASKSLDLKNIFAALIATMASEAAFSESSMASSASSFGKTSTPFKKGSSASWHFACNSPARSTFFFASTMPACSERPSRCPFILVFAASSWPRRTDTRLFSASISALAAAFAFLDSFTISFVASFSSVNAMPKTPSAATMFFSGICAPPSGNMPVAFSISISAPMSWSEIAVSAFRAAMRAANSFEKVLYGPSFACAFVIFCSSWLSSDSAFFCTFGAYCRAAAVLATKVVRTSVIRCCTSAACASTSWIALVLSPSSGGAPVISNDAEDSVSSTAASTVVTELCSCGNNSANASWSVASFAFNFSSASFFCFSAVALWAVKAGGPCQLQAF
mmetsp:Transcript_81874/g.228135  ORF Transcript_81874/g.228135 Transcript_81874/m.228135 type:complete len:437 (+) Transcript_81874:3907-5217(+)